MTPGLRKFALTAHITASVGWLGAVIAYLVLAAGPVVDPDIRVARAAYPAMELLVRSVIVPLSLAALATGVAQSLITAWGLARHYWVLAKLLLNALATALLLLYAPSIERTAAIAAKAALSDAEVSMLRSPAHVIHAGGALVLLLAATALAVYKPRGRVAGLSGGRRGPRRDPSRAR